MTQSVQPPSDAPSGTHEVDPLAKANLGQTAPPPAPPAATDALRKRLVVVLVTLLTLLFGYYVYWLVAAESLGGAAVQTDAWLRGLKGPPLTAYAVMLAPLLLLLLTTSALLVKSGMPKVWESARRSALLGVLLGACLLAAGLLTSDRLKSLSQLDWVYFVAVVPPVLLGFQALVVWRQRPRSLGRFSLGVSKTVVVALRTDGTIERFENVYQQLLRIFGGRRPVNGGRNKGSSAPEDVEGGAYNPTYFVTNFAVPALLLLLVGFGAISMAVHQSLAGIAPEKWEDVLVLAHRGLRWGVAGAFVYVLTEFGARFFRNDLTVGAAIWGIVTLIVGPVLAVVLAVAWKMDPGTAPWQSGAVLFFAGLAPRRVVTIVEGIALQLLKAPNEASVASQSVPLTSLRGLSPEIAVRLREENIHDVGSLAYADPVRLVLSLPYDLRQVIDWIDQAQLAIAIPTQFEALRNAGVTGAIDLAWRWLNSVVKVENGEATLDAATPVPESMKALVANPERDAVMLFETARQLFYEEQVCLLWVMYNCFSTTAGSLEPSTEQPAPPATGATTEEQKAA